MYSSLSLCYIWCRHSTEHRPGSDAGEQGIAKWQVILTHRAAILAIAVPVTGFFVPALPLRYRSFFFNYWCFIILSRFSCFGFFCCCFLFCQEGNWDQVKRFTGQIFTGLGQKKNKSQEWRATGKVDHCDLGGCSRLHIVPQRLHEGATISQTTYGTLQRARGARPGFCRRKWRSHFGFAFFPG